MSNLNLIALCILNEDTGETRKVLIFTTPNSAIEYVIDQELPYLDDPNEVSQIMQELQEDGSIYGHNSCTRGSYRMLETQIVR